MSRVKSAAVSRRVTIGELRACRDLLTTQIRALDLRAADAPCTCEEVEGVGHDAFCRAEIDADRAHRVRVWRREVDAEIEKREARAARRSS